MLFFVSCIHSLKKSDQQETKRVGDKRKSVQLPLCCSLRNQDFFQEGVHSSLGSTSTPINHIGFFCRIPVVLENRRSSRGKGGGGAHPLHPPLDPFFKKILKKEFFCCLFYLSVKFRDLFLPATLTRTRDLYPRHLDILLTNYS